MLALLATVFRAALRRFRRPAQPAPAHAIASRGFHADDDDIAAAMARLVRGSEEDELTFDPATGQIVVRRRTPEGTSEEPSGRSSGSMPATTMAKNGFFGGADRSDRPAAPRPTKTADRDAIDELFFDPVRGEIIVRAPADTNDAPQSGAVPATRMARDGFFGGARV